MQSIYYPSLPLATHQNDLGLIELLLHSHNAVGMFRILVFFQVPLQLWIYYRVRPPLVIGESHEKLVQHLVQDRERHARRILLVRDEHTSDALGAGINVADVI